MGVPKGTPTIPGGSHNPLCCTWLHNFRGECWYKDSPSYGCWGVGCTACPPPTPSPLSAPCGMVTLMFGIPRGPRASAPGLLVSGLPTLGCGWETLQGLPTTHLGASPVGTPCPVPAQFPQSQPSRDARSQAQPPWCLLTAITSPVTPSPAPKAPPSWSILSQADPVGTTGYQGRWVGGPEHHLVEGAGGGWQRIISGSEVTHHCVYFFFLNKRLEKEKKKTTQTTHNEMESQNQKALQRCDGCSSAAVPCPTSGLVWGHPSQVGSAGGEKGTHSTVVPPLHLKPMAEPLLAL